ncbi:MAG TPA: alkaline phosphatase family protein, partial [Blastocatellia bacterium]
MMDRPPDSEAKLAPGRLLLLLGLMVVLSGCRGLVAGSSTQDASLQSINHIIFMAQENRGFDHYFGAVRQYWAANGIADQSFDGLPQFNPTSGLAPLRGAAPTNPGCDPRYVPPNDCTIGGQSPKVGSFPMVSMCVETPSPSWNESHVDWSLGNPVAASPSLNGFVWTAAHDARANQPQFSDVNGVRAMGYYDENDLPYYYFMASKFATSDRWFSPVMSRTQPNRLFMLAATSAGHVYPLPAGGAPLANLTIFDALQKAGVSWKVYVTDLTHATPPINDSTLNMFASASKYPTNIVPVSQYSSDLAGGSLPSVSFIDPGYSSGLDEHPGLDDGAPGGSVQLGSQYVASL